MSHMKRLLEEMEPDQSGHDSRLDNHSVGDYTIIGNEKYYPDQLRFFCEAWQMLVDEHGRIPEMTAEQEAVARYLKLYPPSKVIGVEIDGKKYRGTVYLVDGQEG